MEMLCNPATKNASLVAPLMVCTGITGFLLFKMPDKIGRKPTLLLFTSVLTLAQVLAIFIPDFRVRQAFYATWGICSLKVTVPYAYSSELVETRLVPVTSTVLSSFDSSTLGIVCLYFMFVSRDWYPINLAMTIV